MSDRGEIELAVVALTASVRSVPNVSLILFMLLFMLLMLVGSCCSMVKIVFFGLFLRSSLVGLSTIVVWTWKDRDPRLSI